MQLFALSREGVYEVVRRGGGGDQFNAAPGRQEAPVSPRPRSGAGESHLAGQPVITSHQQEKYINDVKRNLGGILNKYHFYFCFRIILLIFLQFIDEF